MTADMSAFRPYSLGTVAENKDETSADLLHKHTIKVMPHERLPQRDGEIKSNATSVEYATKDSLGFEDKGLALVDHVVEATWLPDSDNRVTAPNVRRGEQVVLYQVGDSDQYYWRTDGRGLGLRQLETVIYAFGGSPDAGGLGTGKIPDLTKCYLFEISTHNRTISLSTSMANGELNSYNIQIDGGRGQFNLEDDLGNKAHVNSQERLIHLENADGAFVELNKVDINAYAPQDLSAQADHDMSLIANNNISVKAGNTLVLDGGGSTQTHTAAGIVVKAPDWQGGP